MSLSMKKGSVNAILSTVSGKTTPKDGDEKNKIQDNV